MTRTEFNKLLAELQTHAEAAKEILKKLLDVVENDHVFKKKGTGYNVAEGDLVPKWEVRSVMCLWADACNLDNAVANHIRCAKDEKDTLADVDPDKKPDHDK
jgi:hypothetical protein